METEKRAISRHSINFIKSIVKKMKGLKMQEEILEALLDIKDLLTDIRIQNHYVIENNNKQSELHLKVRQLELCELTRLMNKD